MSDILSYVKLLFVLLSALLLLPVAVSSQEEEPTPDPVTATALGWLQLRGSESPISVSLTNAGPLVALAPIVEALQGELEIGPLGQSHRLKLLESEFMMGPESPFLTKGEEIIPISQAPVAGDGGLHVPIDLLERTYGELLGYDLDWDARFRRLTVVPRPLRDLPVEVDYVHFQGVTTLVLQFPETPRYQVHRRTSGLIEVEMIADRLLQRRTPAVVRDPLLRRIDVQTSRVKLWLGPDAVAADPYVLRDPYRLVFDISRRLSRPAVSARQPRRLKGTGVRTIVVDPGHGGAETGAIGKSGTAEKDLTLLLAQALKARIERRLPAVKVVLTRNEDVELPLETRTALANQHQADLFVSLHLNSSVGPEAHGAETYFLSLQASDAGAASAARVENQPAEGSKERDQDSDDGSYGLQLILWDLAQSHHLAESQKLATLIQRELNQTLKLRDRGVRQAPFRVLMGATMPAVLVELGFLSNPSEEAKLQNPNYRGELVDALLRAIGEYRSQVAPTQADSSVRRESEGDP